MNKGLFSSYKQDWVTPDDLFKKLDDEFHFTIDVAADENNAKCKRFYTKENSGLEHSWENEVVWCNPPYEARVQDEFVRKCFGESQRGGGATCVMLIPARTDTARFHDYIWGKAEVRFLRGRLKFSGAKGCAPFPSMIVIFRPDD